MAIKLLVTGGPGGGKSTVIRRIEEEFRGRVLCVPEAATLLLSGGFPPPGEKPHPSDLAAFQRTIFTVIVNLEELFMNRAKREGIALVLCDRGRLDGEAYMNSREEFLATVGLNDRAPHLAAYDEVIHLESSAPHADFTWSHTSGNEHRMERSSSIAARIERRTWEAWRDHHNARYVSHAWGFQAKGVLVRNRVLEILGSV